MRYFQLLKDWWRGVPLGGVGRSSRWPQVRKDFLIIHPHCGVCGGKDKLEVHHILPFNLHPEMELDFTNLITLCEKHDCHLMFGHLGSYKSYNPSVRDDAAAFIRKIKTRI